jgi:DNA-binding MarR family transcriptional regulator
MSSRYDPWDLGDVQKEILKHILICKENSENISHISKAIGKLQPSVQRSAEFLIEQDYLTKSKKYSKRKKEVQLTEKGAAAALLLGGNIDQLEEYYDKMDRRAQQYFQMFKVIFKSPEKKEQYIKRGIEYYFRNNFFEKGQTRQEFTEEERKKLSLAQLQIATESFESVGLDNKSIRNFGEFLDKYKIDRDLMKEYLSQRKKAIERALSEIDNKKDNEGKK